MNEREKFIDALQKNEDDTPVRLVFADWLDEQGEHEEADRHRKWPASKAWIICFCEDHQSVSEYDDYPILTYSHLMEDALNAVADASEVDGQGHISCGNNMDLRYSDQWREFWKHWSVVSGIVLHPDVVDKIGYSCAC